MSHLLVTNDFPPKLGGIQSQLWELWRRLDPTIFSVLTAPYNGDAEWDSRQPFAVRRTRQRVLLPAQRMARQIDSVADEMGASLVMFGAFPLALVGPHLSRPYGIMVHGAEIPVLARLPGTRGALRRALRGACEVVAAGRYPGAEAEKAAGVPLPITLSLPGVDVERFRPLSEEERRCVRRQFGLPEGARLVLSVSRLVRRKGMDTLIRAGALLASTRPDVVVAIAGEGRDEGRLKRIAARTHAPVRLLGAVPDEDLAALYGAADVFAMLCRNRWMGLEQEGFGIVFLEAAACGVPQVAGASGGAGEAVVNDETGLLVEKSGDPEVVSEALARLLDDEAARETMGAKARARVATEFSYDALASDLAPVFERW